MNGLLWFSICLMCYHLPAVETVRGKLLFASTRSLSIIEVDVDTLNMTVLVGYGGGRVRSLDYDYENRYVYFPRNNFNDIVRFPYPSPIISLQHVVSTTSVSSGIAVDPANDHVYWVNDDGGRKLSRCKSDGSNVVVLLSTLSHTYMLRVDILNSWMYIGYFNTGISKSNFDLTNLSMIVNFTSTINIRAVCMDLDRTEQRLYWMNYDGDIKSVNVNGSDLRTVISTNSPSNYYYAIGVLGNTIYYADNNKLVMRKKAQGSPSTVIYTDTNTIYSIYMVLDSTDPQVFQY